MCRNRLYAAASTVSETDVVRIRAVADPIKLGYAVIVIVGPPVGKAQLREAEEYICAPPWAWFVGVTMGSCDPVLDAWFRSWGEMVHLTTDTLAAVPGIGTSDSLQVIRLSKYTYDWADQTTLFSGSEYLPTRSAAIMVTRMIR